MSGKRPQERVGIATMEHYAPNAKLVADIRRALSGDEFSAEHVIDGAVLETHYRPMRDQDGRVTGTVGVSVDITARRRAEEERAKMQAALLHAQKLEGLGVLAGGIAHDFNNLLSGILGNASLALADPASEENVQRLQDIVLIARQASDLARQMLAYAGRTSIDVRPIDLSQQVRDVARLLRSSVSRKVDLVLDLEDSLPLVEVDASQVRQVAINLVMNAAEAIGEGTGSVHVTTSARDLDPAAVADLITPGSGRPLPAGRFVVLEVADTGSGMDGETKARIFEPFFTTKFAGRGLGLAMVLGIVRSHGGAIRVESAPARGTRFEIFFPISTKVAAVAATHREPAVWRGDGTVLIVDDEEYVRTVSARILEHFGFQTRSARDGREAAEIFRAHADSIRVVLLDLTMPGWDGEQTLRELRRHGARVRTVLSSGYDELEVRGRFGADPLVAFLQKPYSASELIAKIREALDL
jgi:signal transduction histidine kinase